MCTPGKSWNIFQKLKLEGLSARTDGDSVSVLARNYYILIHKKSEHLIFADMYITFHDRHNFWRVHCFLKDSVEIMVLKWLARKQLIVPGYKQVMPD